MNTLPIVSSEDNTPKPQLQNQPIEQVNAQNKPVSFNQEFPNVTNDFEEDIFVKIEKLADLKDKGILSEEEFNNKKSDLLSRL